MFAGRFASSRPHLEEVVALHDPISDHSLVHQVGFYPHVNSQGLLGIVLFCLGFPDEALARSNAAIVDARRLAHLPSLAVSLANGITALSLVGDNAALDEWVDQVVAVTTEQGFPVWRAHGTIFRGWVRVKNGDVAEGISLLRSGLSAYRATGGRRGRLIFSPSCQGHMRSQGKLTRRLPGWTTLCRSLKGRDSAGSRRSSIGSKANCCCGKGTSSPPNSS